MYARLIDRHTRRVYAHFNAGNAEPAIKRFAEDAHLIFRGRSSLAADLKGKPVVLNFWASWCYPACYEEAPLLESTWKRFKDQGLMVVGVDIQDKEPNALEFMRRFGFTFPNAPDPGSKVSIDYGVYGVPETFFIDAAGIIRAKQIGPMGAASLELALSALVAVLKQPPAPVPLRHPR